MVGLYHQSQVIAIMAGTLTDAELLYRIEPVA